MPYHEEEKKEVPKPAKVNLLFGKYQVELEIKPSEEDEGNQLADIMGKNVIVTF